MRERERERERKRERVPKFFDLFLTRGAASQVRREGAPSIQLPFSQCLGKITLKGRRSSQETLTSIFNVILLAPKPQIERVTIKVIRVFTNGEKCYLKIKVDIIFKCFNKKTK